jgi:hypothetical protein
LQLASLASTAGIGLEQTNDMKSGISIISEQSKNTDQKAGSRDDKCSICLCDFTCCHSFCAGCIDEAFKHQKKCPICSQVYGPLIGNQPPGEMIDNDYFAPLPGFELYRRIVISYRFPNGTQGQTILILVNHTREQNKLLIYLTTKKGREFLNF